MNKSPTKLKTLPRPLFSCGIFRNCTQSVLSPTTPPSHDLLPPPSLPLPPPNPALQQQPQQPSSSSSSSSSTSPSFTQWRFPLTHEPCSVNSSANLNHGSSSGTSKNGNFEEVEERFKAGAKVAALRALEKSVTASAECPMQVIVEVVNALRDPHLARSAAKVLLAIVLVEANRRRAVEAEAVGAAVEAVVASSSSGVVKGTTTAERALAALELMCTVEEGLTEVRKHALAVPAMASAVESMEGRGKECAIGVLSAVYGGDQAKDAPDEVVRAVMVAMQGECSPRGRRKGALLLRALQQCGRLDLELHFDG